MKTSLWAVGLILSGLLMITSCGLPKQTTFGVGDDGGLRTIVIPDDAEVFVDGVSMGAVSQYRGRTFIPVTAGQHLVEIKKPGYATYTKEIFVRGNMQTLTITLTEE